MKQFDPTNKIETDRLILRYMNVNDTHAIFLNINSDKEVLKYFVDRYVEKESDMILDKIIKFCLDNQRYLFAIELKETHEVIGMILQCSSASPVFNTTEIGYAIGRKYWNKGYATEALKAMIGFVFSQGAHKVYVSHIIGNDASKRVIQKCGLVHEGIRKEDIHYHEQYFDVDYYYLLNPNK